MKYCCATSCSSQLHFALVIRVPGHPTAFISIQFSCSGLQRPSGIKKKKIHLNVFNCFSLSLVLKRHCNRILDHNMSCQLKKFLFIIFVREWIFDAWQHIVKFYFWFKLLRMTYFKENCTVSVLHAAEVWMPTAHSFQDSKREECL